MTKRETLEKSLGALRMLTAFGPLIAATVQEAKDAGREEAAQILREESTMHSLTGSNHTPLGDLVDRIVLLKGKP